MNRMTSFLRCLLVFSLMLAPGCAGAPENAVTASDGVQIAFDVRGAGEPTIVLVHGWSNDHTIWDAQIAHFSQHHQVIALDLPGFGESDGDRTDWSMARFGDDVFRVVDALGPQRVVLVGFSMGGPVVVEAARRMPDRVAGIVLVESMKDVDVKLPEVAMHARDSVFMDVVNHPTLEKTGYFFRKNREASFQRVLDMVEGGPRPGWRESLAFMEPNLSGVGGIHFGPLAEELVMRDVVPSLVAHDPGLAVELLHDQRDLFVPELRRAVETSVPSDGICAMPTRRVASGAMNSS